MYFHLHFVLGEKKGFLTNKIYLKHPPKQIISNNIQSHYCRQSKMGRFMSGSRGVFRNFELRVLTVIDCPKIAGAKGQ